MLTRLLIVVPALCALLAATGFAQGQTAVPFLFISPSAEANGMGEASVARLTDDAVALAANPAHLGLQAGQSILFFGRNEAAWLPTFGQSDLWIRSYALAEGVNLKKAFGIEPELFFGVAYAQVFLNLGSFVVTEGSPVPIDTFEATEAADQYTIAAGIDYWVRASAGVTFKRVASTLAPPIDIGGQTPAGMTVDTYDYGVLLDVPILGIASRLGGGPVGAVGGLSPYADLSFGFANNNLGDREVTYGIGEISPLPRYARVGIGWNLGVAYAGDGFTWKPLGFTWTREANDVLVRRTGTPSDPAGGRSWEYQSGLGDIGFFDEVVLGNTNPQTIRKTGWEFTFFELLSIRGGRFEEDPAWGNRRFSTSGFGVRLSGLMKFLRSVRVTPDGVLGFAASHLDLRYDHSDLTADEPNHPLSGTRFDAFHVILTN